MKLDYLANNFAAWDRWGRVVNQLWADYGTSPTLWQQYTSANADPDHFSYVYDRAGNVTSRTNVLHAAFSETYGYDNLDRLTSTL